MLKLIVENKQLDFSGNIKIKMLSPLFYDMASVSYSLTFDDTPVNNKIFGYLKYAEASVNSYKYPLTIMSDDISLKGILTVSKTADGKYSGSFVVSSILDALKTVKTTSLTDVYPLTQFTTPQQVLAYLNEQNNGEGDFVFPVINNITRYTDNLYKNRNKFGNLFDNRINSTFDYSNAYYPNFGGEIYGYECEYVPFFYLHKVLEKLLLKLNLYAKTNCFSTDFDFKKLILFNMTAINKYYYDINHILPSDVTASAVEIGDDNAFSLTIDIPKEYLSSYKAGDVVTITQTVRNHPIMGSGAGHTEFRDLHLTHKFFIITEISTESMTLKSNKPLRGNDFLDTSSSTAWEYREPTDEEIDSKAWYWWYEYGFVLTVHKATLISSNLYDIDISKHLPEMTVLSLINELEKYLFVKFIFSENENSVDIVKLKDIITSTDFIEITEYCKKALQLDFSPIDGYQCNFTIDSNDTLFTESQLEGYPGINELKAEFNLIEPVLRSDNLPAIANNNDCCLVQTENVFYVYAKEEGVLFLNNWYNSKKQETSVGWKPYTFNRFGKTVGAGTLNYKSLFSSFNDTCQHKMTYYPSYEKVKINPRLSFFHSQIVHPLTNTTMNVLTEYSYWLKWMQLYPIDGAGLSLDYETATSIPNALGKEWLYWNMNIRKDVTTEIQWPAKILANFSWTKKVMINGSKYLVKSYELDISDSGVSCGTSELALT